MAGSDTAPFLSQADDPDDGPVPGNPGLPGSMGNPKSEEPEVPDQEGLQRITGLSPGHSALIVAVLCYINLLNYMDRFTVAGVLPDIEQFFNIGDSSSGLIQTVFISSYMVLAPVFGYLGDRYNRKYLMCGGIAFWSLVTLGSSFIPGEHFWLLLLTRGLVGVGEASYSTIAPTLIADLFVADQRSRMLSIFYFAIPVGSGLGYIAGSKVKDMAGDWHWALRVTPGLGVVAVLLLFLVVREPPRGAVERHSDSPPLNPTSWWADLRALARNPSFVLSSLGFTAVAFVTGSLALWAPAFLLRSRVVLGETPPCLPGDSCSSSDSLIFGLITCLTGVLGVGLGVEISRRLRHSNPRADPLVCAAGLLGSAPFLFLSLACARGSIVATYIFIFIGETLLSMNWAIVADILLYVVIPTRRSTAEAFQIVLSHLLGDAGSPYLIGLISDRLRRNWPPSFLSEFRALQFSLMLCAFVGALGGAAFLGTAIFIEGDRRRAQLHVQGLLHEAGPTDDQIVVPQRGRSTRVPVASVLI
ncbi:protein spinster homolog 1 isoform X2 [Macaca nemestrina]|uniref:Protein spinster homolog 1 n=9 Tax=Cercopithecidae TaxID=9527 RepID=A0A8J8XJR0_MACMU|nr:protein spinster homolog 1 isoform X1 [Macaca fascicularis]XP_005591590.1 protein spinster homolog 1 isoform X1 [Macaca fascicularis]XP_011741538.1 protein spinster homolog 1 isoform X2 [Macaca nemestrina]XP_014981334.1 protein spinster homolog 1 isoform X3 [Macaca mulatta]XP_050629893.1 protein spinster homolog 1 isoform X3 [Macaca thibetana thibetana]EHH31540.1 Spinster-like protein 1 [Macaca mulatta]EHH60273.1 Spinster-like protein 1 [Macaca fascicularis]